MHTNTNETSPWKLGGLSALQLVKRAWAEMIKDDAFDASAALGYYFLLSLFPMLIFLVSLITFLTSSTDLLTSFLDRMHTTMPPDAYKMLSDQLTNVFAQSKSGLLTFGALGTLWAASSGVTSLMDGLNRAYEVTEARSFIKKRLVALGLTIGFALLTIIGSAMLVASDQVGTLLVKWTGFEWLKTVAAIFSTLLGLGFMFGGLELAFYFGPNVKGQKWSWVSPGSLLGVVIFIIVSFGFSIYLRFSNTYNATYGSIGGVIILMLWLYNLGLAILIGGEVNSEIAKAARARGDKRAPRVGEEKEDADGAEPQDSSEPEKRAKSNVTPPEPKRNRALKPVLSGPTFAPPVAYARDDAGMSVQAKRRMAMRRIARNEASIERRQMHATGWGILKRPLVSLVYLGSIGFYLFQAITRNLDGAATDSPSLES